MVPAAPFQLQGLTSHAVVSIITPDTTTKEAEVDHVEVWWPSLTAGHIKRVIKHRLRPVVRSWPVHNLVAHPVSEVVYQLGAVRIAAAIHDRTIPSPSDKR